MPKQDKQNYYERNREYVSNKDGPFETALGRADEARFRQWLKYHADAHPALGNFNPNDPTSDYDLRGWWLENNGDAPPAEGGHFTDKYKTPYHQSFSNESMYADPEAAPKWQRQGDTWNLTAPDGTVVFSEPAE